MCGGLTVYNGLRQLKVVPGAIVAVQGVGGLGHLAIQFAKKMGYRVVAISGSASKKELATSLGARYHTHSCSQPNI